MPAIIKCNFKKNLTLFLVNCLLKVSTRTRINFLFYIQYYARDLASFSHKKLIFFLVKKKTNLCRLDYDDLSYIHEYLFGYQAKDLCIFMHRKYGSTVDMVWCRQDTFG